MKEANLARNLLSSAERDLKAIRNMTDPDLFADEVFGFHAQQAVEKTLKAWIALLGGEYPFVHDLDALLNALKKLGVDVDALWGLVELNAFAVQFRYEAFESQDEPLDRRALTVEATTVFRKVSALLKGVRSVH
jgi:HEPN domain-containing protein